VRSQDHETRHYGTFTSPHISFRTLFSKNLSLTFCPEDETQSFTPNNYNSMYFYFYTFKSKQENKTFRNEWLNAFCGHNWLLISVSMQFRFLRAYWSFLAQEKVTKDRKNCIIRTIPICTPQQTIDDQVVEGELGEECGTHWTEEYCIQDFDRKTWRKDNLKYLSVDGRIILKRLQNRHKGRAWSVFIWLKIWRGGGLLWTR